MRTSDPDFVPPFCPRADCRHHLDPAGWTFECHGTFERKARPRIIRRFRCLSDLALSFTETDVSAWLQFFDLRIANACELQSRDDEPPGRDGLLTCP